MNFRLISAYLLFAALSVFPALGQGILGIDGEEATSVGLYIKDLASGSVIVDHNSQLALTPASVMKAVTTASVLSANGADDRFVTQVRLRGAKGAAGLWNGDIVVNSCGDPTIESENYKSRLGFCDSIVAALKRKGIRKISGAIVVKQSLKDSGPNIKWEIEDVAWPYGAGLYGFNWRDNCTRVYPVTGKTVPEVPGLKVTLTKVTGGNDLVRGVYSDRLMAYTRDTNNRKWALSTTVPDPAAVFTLELKKKLTAAGITIGSKAAAPDGAETALYTHRSPDFADIMRSLMVRSDNLFAEAMLRRLAPGDSRDKAIKRVKEIWATRGINTRYTIINDGSGLTRANRLSARFIGDILEWMARSPMAATYAGFFPRAGKDGTLRGFLAKTPLVGEIALKTGSVSSVQCYAGYKLDADGAPTHVVVMMVNGFFCPRRQVRVACERILLDTFVQSDSDL
ncbi:MAG: D-alanyl-D-alanine carboxypeptidase [Muribaculaceae bacterium]|nr:D-alanyl-D-alanine carboxypeptidase [Muribaculaceae bacterium]